MRSPIQSFFFRITLLVATSFAISDSGSGTPKNSPTAPPISTSISAQLHQPEPSKVNALSDRAQRVLIDALVERLKTESFWKSCHSNIRSPDDVCSKLALIMETENQIKDLLNLKTEPRSSATIVPPPNLEKISSAMLDAIRREREEQNDEANKKADTEMTLAQMARFELLVFGSGLIVVMIVAWLARPRAKPIEGRYAISGPAVANLTLTQLRNEMDTQRVFLDALRKQISRALVELQQDLKTAMSRVSQDIRIGSADEARRESTRVIDRILNRVVEVAEKIDDLPRRMSESALASRQHGASREAVLIAPSAPEHVTEVRESAAVAITRKQVGNISPTQLDSYNQLLKVRDYEGIETFKRQNGGIWVSREMIANDLPPRELEHEGHLFFTIGEGIGAPGTGFLLPGPNFFRYRSTLNNPQAARAAFAPLFELISAGSEGEDSVLEAAICNLVGQNVTQEKAGRVRWAGLTS